MGIPRLFRCASAGLAFTLGAGVGLAQTPIMSASPTTTYGFYGPSGYSASAVNATGPGFTRAIRVTCGASATNIWDSQLYWFNTAPVTAGDLVQVSFYVRKRSALDGTPVRGEIALERAGSPYTKSMSGEFPADSMAWRRYSYVTRAAETYAADDWAFRFQLGRGPQSIEIGGLSAWNWGANVLPQQVEQAYYYPGMDLNATWRAEAESRIEAYRKGNLRVRVEDVDGREIPGARVEVRMTRPEFKWGSAVVGSRLAATNTENLTYQAKVRELFTTTVLENDLKWPFVETWAETSARQGMAWLRANNLPVRGHNLIWPSWRHMPGDTQALSAANLRTRIDNHFSQILNEFRGQLYDWDVLNEPYDNHDVQGRIPGVTGVSSFNGVLGNAEAVRWFQNARALDPTAKLYLNDYNLIENDDPNHRAYTRAFLQYLLNQGAPVDGMGFQSHFGSNIPGIQPILDNLASFSEFPVEMAVTEYDLPTLNETLQADFLRDYMTIIFSQPKFNQFLLWGFWEKAHWIATAAMLRADFSEKPAAAVWRDYVFNRWWTSATLATGLNGEATLRGFKGAHRLTAGAYGQTSAVDSVIEAADRSVTVRLSARVPRLVGRLNRTGWVGSALSGQSVVVELRAPGSTAPRYALTSPLASDGSYRIYLPADVAPGTVDVSVKWGPYLRRTIMGVALPTSGSNSLNFSLIPGDVDGDNAITVFDYDLLSAAFDASDGSPNWNALADLDGDGGVTVFDYDLLSQNFDLNGDA